MKKNHELGALIASIQERNGWSDRDLQERAEALGLTALSKSNFSRWRTSPVNSIKGSNIRDMAAVLGIAESTVARAALESMGVTMAQAGSTSLDNAIALDVELSARDKHVVRAVVDALRSTEEMTGHGHTAPITHAGESPAKDSEPRGGDAKNPSLAEMLPHEDQEYPAAGVNEDELSRWRREREGREDALGRGVASSAQEETIPVPDEDLMAGYDAPSEGRRLREQQDAEAEGPQSDPRGE